MKHLEAARPRAALEPSAIRMAISRGRRRRTRARKRFATFAQAMSSTIVATPIVQSGGFTRLKTRVGSCADSKRGGERARLSETHRRDMLLLPLGVFQLFTYAWLRSAEAAGMLTPGFRRTIISIHPQL